MAADKILTQAGPLERLFSGSPNASILDFLILAAPANQAYSDSEIARLSGIAPKKTKAAIVSLQKLGLVTTHVSAKLGKRGGKKYQLNRESGIMIPLEKLILAMTDTELSKPDAIQKITADIGEQLDQGIGQTVAELVEKGLVKLDGQEKPD